MPQDPGTTDSRSLRKRLMTADPMQRICALHALEVEAERRSRGAARALAHEASEFASRGIPYYDPNDPYFKDWVDKAAWYWDRLLVAAAPSPEDRA